MNLQFTLDNQIPTFMDAIEGKIEAQLRVASMLLEGKVKEKLSGQRSGRFYLVPGTAKRYRASAPLEAPAVRTGHLRSTYTSFVEGSGYDAVGIVASPLAYSVHLEYGTSKMAIRPHLRKTMYENKAEIEQIVGEIFK